MRVLYKDMACALCKEQLRVVVVTRDDHTPFAQLLDHARIQDATAMARFEDTTVLETLARQWALLCPRCPSLPPFKAVHQLKAHVLQAHKLQYCTVCLDARKSFYSELALYTKDELTKHAATHPQCDYCRSAHFDAEALFYHCTSSHETCFLCERLGVRHQYFKDYSHLWRHFCAKHHVCDEAECKALRFIAFASQTELQAHRLQQHRDRMSKDELLDAKRLAITVTHTSTASASARSGITLHGGSGSDLSSATSAPASADASAVAFPDIKPEGALTVLTAEEGAVLHGHALPRDDKELKARNGQLRRLVKEHLGGEEARLQQFVALSGDLRSGKVSAKQYYAELAQRYHVPAHLFAEIVALLPDIARRRALIECYLTKPLPISSEQQAASQHAESFPALAAAASMSLAPSAPATAASAAGGQSTSYRSLVSRGGPSGSTAALSAPNAFPELPSAAPSRRGGRGGGGNGVWNAPQPYYGQQQQEEDQGVGRGRGKKGKQNKVMLSFG